VGADADIVVFDPDYRGVVSMADHHVNNDYSGFEGFEQDGRPVVVTVRGQIAIRDGEFVGDTSRGKLIRRKPSH
jgi:dihydropyrimidinase